MNAIKYGFVTSLRKVFSFDWDNMTFLLKFLFKSVQICAYCIDSNFTPYILINSNFKNTKLHEHPFGKFLL